MLIFGVRRLLFLKNCQMRPGNSFFAVFSENTAFFEKIVDCKNIQHQISDKKGYIHFWCKVTVTGRTVSQLDVLQTK